MDKDMGRHCTRPPGALAQWCVSTAAQTSLPTCMCGPPVCAASLLAIQDGKKCVAPHTGVDAHVHERVAGGGAALQ
jgi:hypothetical protein